MHVFGERYNISGRNGFTSLAIRNLENVDVVSQKEDYDSKSCNGHNKVVEWDVYKSREYLRSPYMQDRSMGEQMTEETVDGNPLHR